MNSLLFLPTGQELLESLPIFLSVVFVDSLLSVDNGLIVAARAAHLPDLQRRLALNLGMLGALGIRMLSLFAVGLLIANPWLKLVGGAYLVHMMCKELALAEHGAKTAAVRPTAGFGATIASIMVADFVFSIDNVVAASALSPRLWVVCAGVVVSMIILMFAVHLFSGLIERFPILEKVAYLLVGLIGIELLLEYFLHIDLGEAFKVEMIVAVVTGAFFYDRFSIVRAFCQPFFYPIGRAMAIVAGSVDWLLSLPKRLFGSGR